MAGGNASIVRKNVHFLIVFEYNMKMETKTSTILSRFRAQLEELRLKRRDINARLLRVAETKKIENIRKQLGI
jgi:hypothetical protein